jgi:hypothetical protein
LSVPAKPEFANLYTDGDGVSLTFGQIVCWLEFLQLAGHCRVDLHLGDMNDRQPSVNRTTYRAQYAGKAIYKVAVGGRECSRHLAHVPFTALGPANGADKYAGGLARPAQRHCSVRNRVHRQHRTCRLALRKVAVFRAVPYQTVTKIHRGKRLTYAPKTKA